ncbi:MAG: preprotein translocase subunit YajC [Rickettsiales bacterium]|jgi:preprotein translocase subunit YajC|nr:preprotein translocase subunit YajC [Rickettsiales bacterium]
MEEVVVNNGNGMGGLIVWVVLLFAFMWFFMLRPNKKRMEEIQKMQSGLKAGDRVVAAGGIVGVVKKIECDRVKIELAKGVEIEVLKAAVSGLDKK